MLLMIVHQIVTGECLDRIGVAVFIHRIRVSGVGGFKEGLLGAGAGVVVADGHAREQLAAQPLHLLIGEGGPPQRIGGQLKHERQVFGQALGVEPRGMRPARYRQASAHRLDRVVDFAK
jgi:hypothetical protein